MFVMQTFGPCFCSLAALFQLKCSWACLKMPCIFFYIGFSAVNPPLFVEKSLQSESRWSLYYFPQCRVWNATDSDDKQGDKAQLTFSYCTEEAIKSVLFLSQTARQGFMSQYRLHCSLSGLCSLLPLPLYFFCSGFSLQQNVNSLEASESFYPLPVQLMPQKKNCSKLRCVTILSNNDIV